ETDFLVENPSTRGFACLSAQLPIRIARLERAQCVPNQAALRAKKQGKVPMMPPHSHGETEDSDRTKLSRLTADLNALLAAVWFEVDHRDGQGVSSHCTPDAEIWFGEHVVRGTAEIDATYAARAKRGPRVSRHLVTNLHVTSFTADRAAAVSCLLLFAQDGQPPQNIAPPAMVGDVRDEFALHDGRWLITSRRMTVLFSSPQTSLAVPTR
ncbi:nuclear transport factor 2 family protein, partial [Streptomyces longwoodensis]|uniref:nuclear transport factor 2 family protein n=1 Tax=Streptomyces longwoodensis TaxID=68231 RepID=UPI0033F4B588